jgi:hypothetical protein
LDRKQSHDDNSGTDMGGWHTGDMDRPALHGYVKANPPPLQTGSRPRSIGLPLARRPSFGASGQYERRF